MLVALINEMSGVVAVTAEGALPAIPLRQTVNLQELFVVKKNKNRQGTF